MDYNFICWVDKKFHHMFLKANRKKKNPNDGCTMTY